MRSPMRVLGLAASLGAACLLSPAVSSRLSAQTVGDSSPVTLDIIGLHRWSRTMLRDSLRKFVPGAEIGDAACMMLLRMNLGFPDAFVNNLAVAYPGQPDRRYLVVKVVEPGDAWRSKWRSVRTPTKWRVPAPYDSVLKILADTAGIIEPGRLVPPLQLFHRTPDHGRAKAETFPERQRIDANALWYLLESQKTRAGFTEAARIVRSGTTSQRMLAAAVLGRFPERNDAWEELIVALRDSSVVVRQVAGISLDAIPLRPIKWSSGSIASLRALLGGTNVEATEYVQIMLIQSGVSPALAAPLLRGNGDWLLMHLAATNPHSSGVTRGFLTRMNRGVDVGSVEQWASWIARL